MLVDFLQGEGYRRFSLMGISLGGMLAFGAPLVEPRLQAVVAILGCPHWGVFTECSARYRRLSPHLSRDAFGETRLLAWNGALDEHIHTPVTRAFMEELQLLFPQHQYLEYPESGHFMRPQDWEDGWRASLNFLSL